MYSTCAYLLGVLSLSSRKQWNGAGGEIIFSTVWATFPLSNLSQSLSNIEEHHIFNRDISDCSLSHFQEGYFWLFPSKHMGPEDPRYRKNTHHFFKAILDQKNWLGGRGGQGRSKYCPEWVEGGVREGQNIAQNGPLFWLWSPLEAPKWAKGPRNGLKSIRGSWGVLDPFRGL